LKVEVLRRAAVTSNKQDTSSEHIFEVISETVCKGFHHFSFEQIVCLGLTNLRHPSPVIRTLAFDMLEALHQQHSGLLAMSTLAPAITSLAPGTYTHAHRIVADFLAGEHPQQAWNILVQLSYWLPSLHPQVFDTNIVLLLLQSFEFWIPNIVLTSDGDEDRKLSSETIQALFHLMKLSLHYQSTHSEQILILWSKLVEPPNHANGDATIQFLVEQSQKVGNTIYIECAANIVACLCQTSMGRRVFEELCSIVVPVRMLPTIDHKLTFPDEMSMALWEDLDALFADHPRITLGAAQAAWLFLSDVSLQRYWEMNLHLPVLLHATFSHLDHRVPFLRYRARSMLFQLLRSWIPGYDELLTRSHQRSLGVIKERVSEFQQDIERYYWNDGDSSTLVEPKMTWVCQKILEFLDPLSPNLASSWGSVALEWGTACSVRAVAFRSLQLFRALMPRVKKTDLAHLLGRLSNTISSPDDNIQYFTSEIFLTLQAVIDTQCKDKSLLPQLYWCIMACLSTTVEEEFNQCLTLLEAMVSKVDFDNPEIMELLLTHIPPDWSGSEYLQPILLKGLRSSVTSAKTMSVLQAFASFQRNRLIDPSDGRLRDLYTISLPWCLHAMDKQDSSLSGFAEKIGALAAVEGKNGIQRIMNSFAKSHFRTRDDFLRQSVSSLREYYGSRHWTEVVTLLMGLVLNSQPWLRTQSMQVLKVLFQHRETRNPVELLGSELLMPLLRLLETDLAPQALEVLEEPISMFGGPAAKHVLRMSMHLGSVLPKTSMDPDSDSVATIFGVPSESGWSIPQEDALRRTCQANVLAVFDTCSIPTRPSRIDFEPEVEALASIHTPLTNANGFMQETPRNGITPKNFQELNAFFQNPELIAATQTPMPIPTRRLEARVAAILAKSTAPEGSFADIPQTPFLDVFRIGASRPDDHIQEQDSDEEDDSDSDSDADSFVFDSIASPSRTILPNGRSYH
jgi:Cell morphogenesis C-terminal/Cell morphogenesis central region